MANKEGLQEQEQIIQLQEFIFVLIMILIILIFAILIHFLILLILLIDFHFLFFLMILLIESVNQVIVSLFRICLILHIFQLFFLLLILVCLKLWIFDLLYGSEDRKTEDGDEVEQNNQLKGQRHDKKGPTQSCSRWQVFHKIYSFGSGFKVIQNRHFLILLQNLKRLPSQIFVFIIFIVFFIFQISNQLISISKYS